MHMASYAVTPVWIVWYQKKPPVALQKGCMRNTKLNDKTTAIFKPSDIQMLRQTVCEHLHAKLYIPICMSAKL